MSAGLSVLPPSPPTTTSRKYASLMQEDEYKHTTDTVKNSNASSYAALGTPDESPASFPCSGSASSKGRKRVEFSPWTNIHNPPVFTKSSPNEVVVRPLLPSRELSSSGSILKVSSQVDLTAQTVGDTPQPQLNLVDMLESVTHQLSRNEVVESIDAYQTLSSTLKAYSEVPDAQAFKSKLGALMQHIRRDLTILDKPENGPAEINLATQALKVLVILAWNRNFSILLSNEIQGFILDRTIHVLEEHKAPKGVILHYLHLLATQDFRHSIIASGGRVGRLLDALKDLTQYVKGNGTVSERLMVYQRLLEQARPHMKARPLSWVHELLDGLTSQSKETRTKAIELGTKAVAIFPSSCTISHALRTVVDVKLEDGKTVGVSACRRLEKMLANKDDGLVVPQIWAVVLSMMKGIEGGIDKWTGLKDWLKIMQRCFNSSNSAIRTQANIAWSRFFYVVSPSEVTASLLGMLIKPIAAQMERKGMDREDRSSRATAFSAYCHLLYYSFRPSASHKQYDRVWDEYVVKFMTNSFLDKSPVAADRACRIFMSLLWHDNSRSKLWREVRAQENVLMEPEELPTIDCKWVRSNSLSILNIFKLLFKNSSWGSEDRPGQSFVATAWKHFSKAMGAACRKEMKPSAEAMQAIAHTLTFLYEAWTTGPSALNALEENTKDAFMTRFRFVCMTVLTEIGAIPLVEGSLPPRSFDVITGKRLSPECAPIVQILIMLSSTTEHVIPNKAYSELIEELLQLPRRARTPTRLRIRLFRESAISILLTNSQSSMDAATTHIWQAIASKVREEFSSSEVLVKLEPEMNDIIEDVTKILEIGLAHSPESAVFWCDLLQCVVRYATHSESQSVASVSTIASSLATCIEKEESNGLMMETAELVHRVLPFIELSVARPSPRHPRGKLRTKKTMVMSPLFNKLLFLLNYHLEHAYTTLSPDDSHRISSIVDATCECLRLCPSDVLVSCLTIMESSLSLWLQDSQRLLTSTNHVGAVKLTAGRKMCSSLVGIFRKSFENGGDLERHSSLLAAGFCSTHKMTINQMIEMWNTTFGSRKQLHYPDKLKMALERLRPFVDLELPTFGDDSDVANTAEPPAFIESQDEDLQDDRGFTESSNSEARSTATCSIVSTPARRTRATASPGIAHEPAPTAKRQTPVAVACKTKSRNDDSQIQYVTIESTPLQAMQNESQFLTDRQKEVRARQQAEPAVIFPDLRSSPSLGSGIVKAPHQKNLSLDLGRPGLIEDNEPTTPTLPVYPNKNGDDTMASSPTPQSKRPVLRLDDIEVPSSPPSMLGVTGPEAHGDAMTSHEATGQMADFGEEEEVLLSSEARNVNNTLHGEADGDASPGEKQLLEVAAFQNNDAIQKDLPLNEDLEEYFEMASLVTARHEVAPLAPLEHLSTTAGRVNGLDWSDPDPNYTNTEEIIGDAVMQGVEALDGASSARPAMPAEAALSQQDLDPNVTIQTDGVSTNNGFKGGSMLVGSENQPDVGMSGMHAPRPITNGQTKQEIGNSEDVPLKRNHCNSLTLNDHGFSNQEPDGFAVVSGSDVVEPQTRSAAQDSHSDSDEVAMLSASQLSQDLNWHVALEVHASQTETSREAEISQSTRKRKRSSGYSAGVKRRKGTGSTSGRDTPLITPPSGAPSQEEADELSDCIVVDTTPRESQRASQSSQLSANGANGQKAGKKRGRPRKLPVTQSSPPAEVSPSAQFEDINQIGARSIEEVSPSSEGEAVNARPIPSPQGVAAVVQRTEGSGGIPDSSPIRPAEPLDSPLMADCPSLPTPTEQIAVAAHERSDGLVQYSETTNGLQPHDTTTSHTIPGQERESLAPDLTNGVAAIAAVNASTPSDDVPMKSTENGTNPRPEPDLVEDSCVDFELGTKLATEEMDITGCLQQVLQRLRSATMGRPALREVEDLLFEIRTEAQYALGRDVARQ